MSTTRWGTLRGAYGPATEVPLLLKTARVAPASKTYSDEPWFSLWSTLCHQGDVYSASYAAVPELIDIATARIREPAAVSDCLLLAAFIELERASPEDGHLPPPLESDLATAYHASLVVGADLASVLLTRETDSERRRTLAIAHAALRGEVAEARRLERLDQ